MKPKTKKQILAQIEKILDDNFYLITPDYSTFDFKKAKKQLLAVFDAYAQAKEEVYE